jgi:MoxR-like ATPase
MGLSKETLLAVKALRDLETEVGTCVFEREDEISIASLALLTGEHAVFLGEPGVAKSALVRAITSRLSGARLFELALHPQCSADDVRGAPNLPALGEGRYEYQTTGRIADCETAFLDEVFKGPPSTLNVLLSALNERVFHNGGRVDSIPLRTCFAASNELPRAGECDALWDRFLFRTYTSALRDPANAGRLFAGDTPQVPVKATLPLATLDLLKQAVKGVSLPQGVVDAALAIRSELRAAGVLLSDRRFTQWGRAVRASALRDGRDVASLDDLATGEHVLWIAPDQVRKVRDVCHRHALPVLGKVLVLLDQITGLASTASRSEATAEERARASAEIRARAEAANSLAKGSAHPRVLESLRKIQGQQDIARRAVNQLT